MTKNKEKLQDDYFPSLHLPPKKNRKLKKNECLLSIHFFTLLLHLPPTVRHIYKSCCSMYHYQGKNTKKMTTTVRTRKSKERRKRIRQTFCLFCFGTHSEHHSLYELLFFDPFLSLFVSVSLHYLLLFYTSFVVPTLLLPLLLRCCFFCTNTLNYIPIE